MKKVTCKFSGSSTDLYMDHRFSFLKKIADPKSTVLITDENVYNTQAGLFKGWNTIILKPGEEYKIQSTVDAVIEQLVGMEADRNTTLVGVGGGVITDITGYTASIYMRGLRFGFVPSSVLAMVDASVGGKNGIDVGVYKNMVGVIRQPSFILYDQSLLKTLPHREWINGFAEIIKHACIRDITMFRELEDQSLPYFQNKKIPLAELVERNVLFKARLVQRDEFEKGERRLLNFGHTLGHALENQYELSHGEAISIGMVCAARISGQLLGFREEDRLTALLGKYGLPAFASFNKEKVFNVLKMDKKRERKEINFILLQKIGKAVIKPIPLKQLEKFIQDL